jgi:hypothetical protein
MGEQQAGWYADPSGDATKLRYWDGTLWTEHYQDMPAEQDGVQLDSARPDGAQSDAVAGSNDVAQPDTARFYGTPTNDATQPAATNSAYTQPAGAFTQMPDAHVQPVGTYAPSPHAQTAYVQPAYAPQPQPVYQQPVYVQPPVVYVQTQAQPTNGLAVAALICGIVGFCTLGAYTLFLPSIAAVILGIMSRKEAGGRAMATVGLVLGIVCLAIWIVVAAVFIIGYFISSATYYY